MITRASYVGELARRVLLRKNSGEATRVFPSSVYLRVGDDFLLLLWGGPRSPMTINLVNARASSGIFRVGQRFKLDRTGIKSGSTSISVESAKVYRGSLRKRRTLAFPAASDLVRGMRMVKSLYDVSAPGQRLTGDSAFRAYISETLVPFAEGDGESVYKSESYAGLIGRGGGFTPAGDDFVAGFVGTFNYIARCRSNRTVVIAKNEVEGKTVPESGAIVRYSSRGFVDEGLEKLIIKSLGGGEGGFHRELLSIASRGHTSGVDMALGVLLCEAAFLEREGPRQVLESCINILRAP